MPPVLPKSRRARVAAVVALLVAVVLWPLMASMRGLLARLDPGVPYWIEFGRGSGWHGLDTVKILPDGTVTLHRRDPPETATMKLPPEALSEVLDAVEKNRLLGLDREYHAEGVADGTQWVLLIRQGGRQKSAYFDNRFPDEIVRFADALDKVLAENGLGKAQWRRVSAGEAEEEERRLWDSISQ